NDLTDVLSRTDGQPRLATRLPGRQGPSLLAMLLGMLETTAHAAVPEGFKEFDWQAMLDHGIPADLIELGKARLNDLEDFQSGFINPYVLETAMVHPEFFRENLLIESDAAQIGWRHARRTLLDIFVRSREAGADVCLVVIPSTLQVSDSHYSLYERMLFDMDPRLLTTNRPQQLLADLCRQADVPIVDLLPAFREDPEDLYWLNDDHMSEKGHRLAWRVLREQYLDEWLARQTASADHP
ncbi:MAG TPA: SGNH/GDSL hydrolase family protein, partial [Firmicutes bacterium]|nr:SGNH/GDSL hydrolase family protein [Candidatus Fermentithermobacillaceae bacterium]